MPNVLLLVPTGVGVGLTTVMLGLSRAFEEHGLRVALFKPIDQNKAHPVGYTPNALSIQQVETILSEGRKDDLLEQIIQNYHAISLTADVVLVYGTVALQEQPYIANLNLDLANTLNANVIVVTATESNNLEDLSHQLEIVARYFGGIENPHLLGCILNKTLGPTGDSPFMRMDLSYLYQPPAIRDNATIIDYKTAPIFHDTHFKLLATIPWNANVLAPRVVDVQLFLNAKVLFAGEMQTRRVRYITLYAKSINDISASLFPDTLIITPYDRSDVIVAVCAAALSGIKLAGILLTGGEKIADGIFKLCEQAMKTGLAFLSVEDNSFRTAVALHNISAEIPSDDKIRIELVKDYVAQYVDGEWLMKFADSPSEKQMSPAAFRYQITQMAQKAKKKIVLPEGTEPRTIAAAAICAERGLAECILLGDPVEVHRVAENNAVRLPDEITIINPIHVMSHYVQPLIDLRKEKGMNEVLAKAYLQDPVVLGTMMLQQGEADGLVSGALHTTANTIRPALQIIKMAAGYKLVSSVFFICLPTQVLVFADCAVNPDPDVEALAQIAIQSADTANAFGIEPRVAMISYSTGASGAGADVDKVIAATALVKKLRPDIVVDGPMQYDAAFVPEVGKLKAPQSPVAGQATVFIFPDLNTGNTTYKAVQRSSSALCIGPMLQGLRKPVNDLSRGATVDDIVYTIAMTAVQAVLASQ